MPEIARTPAQIESMEMEATLWAAANESDAASMSYEEGVSYALRWVLGEDDDDPIESPYEEDSQEDNIVRQRKPGR